MQLKSISPSMVSFLIYSTGQISITSKMLIFKEFKMLSIDLIDNSWLFRRDECWYSGTINYVRSLKVENYNELSDFHHLMAGKSVCIWHCCINLFYIKLFNWIVSVILFIYFNFYKYSSCFIINYFKVKSSCL